MLQSAIIFMALLLISSRSNRDRDTIIWNNFRKYRGRSC